MSLLHEGWKDELRIGLQRSKRILKTGQVNKLGIRLDMAKALGATPYDLGIPKWPDNPGYLIRYDKKTKLSFMEPCSEAQFEAEKIVWVPADWLANALRCDVETGILLPGKPITITIPEPPAQKEEKPKQKRSQKSKDEKQ